MSAWKKLGEWLKDNAGSGAALVGSLLTGNVPGAVAAGVSLVSSATGTDDPVKALESLQRDPQTVVRLRELAQQEQADIRRHLEAIHRETQTTIRAGDVALDDYVRRTRPQIARQSWAAVIAYCLGSWVVHAWTGSTLFDPYIASILSAPAWAYLGMRTADKIFTKEPTK